MDRRRCRDPSWDGASAGAASSAQAPSLLTTCPTMPSWQAIPLRWSSTAYRRIRRTTDRRGVMTQTIIEATGAAVPRGNAAAGSAGHRLPRLVLPQAVPHVHPARGRSPSRARLRRADLLGTGPCGPRDPLERRPARGRVDPLPAGQQARAADGPAAASCHGTPCLPCDVARGAGYRSADPPVASLAAVLLHRGSRPCRRSTRYGRPTHPRALRQQRGRRRAHRSGALARPSSRVRRGPGRCPCTARRSSATQRGSTWRPRQRPPHSLPASATTAAAS